MLRKLSLISGYIFLISNIAVSGNRFVDSVFAEVDTVKGVQYRIAATNTGTIDTLLLDLYTPKNDTMKHRPLVVIIHGGSFMLGDRDDPFCTTTAVYLAKRGFAAVSIKYRLGIEPSALTNPAILPQQFGAATFKAIQDTNQITGFCSYISLSAFREHLC